MLQKIKNQKKRNSKIDVEFPWTPPKPIKELTHFKIIFTDKNKNKMKHLDYIFAIKGNGYINCSQYPNSFRMKNRNDPIKN